MVALGDFNDAVYVRQLWDVHLKSTCGLAETMMMLRILVALSRSGLIGRVPCKSPAAWSW